jgi:hypothetical protein
LAELFAKEGSLDSDSLKDLRVDFIRDFSGYVDNLLAPEKRATNPSSSDIINGFGFTRWPFNIRGNFCTITVLMATATTHCLSTIHNHFCIDGSVSVRHIFCNNGSVSVRHTFKLNSTIITKSMSG